MSIRAAKLIKVLALLGLCLGLLGGLAAAMPLFGLPTFRNWWAQPPNGTAAPCENRSTAELVPDEPDTLRLPVDMVQALHVQTIEAKPATKPRSLQLSGSLALDANQLARVHSRFAGEVAHIDEVPEPYAGGPTRLRPLHPGDRVEQGQLLAVVWSKDLGEKKSELVDALSKLRLDQETLRRLQEGYQSGALPERTFREAEHSVEADEIAVAKADRTLRSWRLTDTEIDAIRAEALSFRQRQRQRSKDQERDWAKVEVRAPFGGKIVEKNVAVGDIVDTTLDLFKVADVNSLAVWAHAYEEDLPALLALSGEQLKWTIRLKSDLDGRPLEGRIDNVADILDPNQHTALVMGRADNPQGKLRAGQFITATIDLPPSPDEVVVPIAALIESGRENVVFVQPDLRKSQYTLRRVVVVRRVPGGACVRSKLTADEGRRGLKPVLSGERVVRSGAVELKALLENLRDTVQPK